MSKLSAILAASISALIFFTGCSSPASSNSVSEDGFVTIPSGTYVVGCDEYGSGCEETAVEAFEISRDPISNIVLVGCVAEDQCNDPHHYRIRFESDDCRKENYSITLNGVTQIIEDDGLSAVHLFPIVRDNSITIRTSCSTQNGVALVPEENGNLQLNASRTLDVDSEYNFQANSSYILRDDLDAIFFQKLLDSTDPNLSSDTVFESITAVASEPIFYHMIKPSSGTQQFSDFPKENLSLYEIDTPTDNPKLFLLAHFGGMRDKNLDAVIFANFSSHPIPWLRIGYSDALKMSLVSPKWR